MKINLQLTNIYICITWNYLITLKSVLKKVWKKKESKIHIAVLIEKSDYRKLIDSKF